jgi:hypothetical protein
MIKTLQNADSVSPENKYLLIKHLLSPATHTRAETAKEVSLSSVTASKVINAMLEAGLLSSEKASGARGRATEIVHPSSGLCALSVSLGENRISASLIGIAGTLIESVSETVNFSLPYEDGLRVFLQRASERFSLSSRELLMGTALIYENDAMRQKSKYIEHALPIKPDAVITRSEAVGCFFSALDIEGSALYLEANDAVHAELFFAGHSVSKNSLGARLESHSDQYVAHRLSEFLITTFQTVVPEYVYITSDTVTTDKKFPSIIRKYLANNNIPDDIIPRFIDKRNISPENTAVLLTLTDITARRLSGFSLG